MGSRREAFRSFSDIIAERAVGPPKDPAEAAASHVYVLAREMLRREVKPDRSEQVLRDFEEAAREIGEAAAGGATWGEQTELLQKFWERFELPEEDFRKRREERGPTDARLIREVEALRQELKPILRDRKKKSAKTIIEEMRPLAPWASQDTLQAAACEAPTRATYVLLGSRYYLTPETIQNRISRAKKRA